MGSDSGARSSWVFPIFRPNVKPQAITDSRFAMHFAYSPRTEALRQQLRNFMDAHVLPRIGAWHHAVGAGQFPVPFMADLKALPRGQQFWTLSRPALAAAEPDPRLSNLEYAPLAEIMGRVSW